MTDRTNDDRGADAPVYLVLGATGGIGSELCRRLHRAGARLALGARGEEGLAELAGELDASEHPLDATDPEAVEHCFGQVEEEHGRLDGVAHLVGSMLLKPAHLTSPEEWRETLEVNLSSSFYVVRQAGKAMRGRGGSVVLMSSAAATTGMSHHEAIAAAKAGVEGLVRAAAASYAARGIRINGVAPGLVDTPLSSRITGNETAREASEAMHALGRLGEPGDVASAVAWLLDREQSWVTGQILGVDGGLARVRPRRKG